MIYNVTLNNYERVCKSCTIYIGLIIIGISSASFIFVGLRKNYFSDILICLLLL